MSTKPTVGRVVLFKSTDRDIMGRGCASIVPALITHVWNDNCVNLMVMRDGSYETPVGVTSVMLSDNIEAHDPNLGPAWGWMAYQKAVAAGEVEPTRHAAS